MKKHISSSPNLLIVIIGVLASILFFIVANLLSGNWSALFINLTAGVAVVVITVILVDALRLSHANKQFVIPRATAIMQIKNANIDLLASLTIERFKSSATIKEFSDAATKTSSTSGEPAIIKVLSKYAKLLCELDATKLLGGYDQKKLQALYGILSKTYDRLEKTRQRYDYSFSDIEFKSDIAQLVDKIEGALSVLSVLNVEDSLLKSFLTTAGEAQANRQEDEALHAFVGVRLLSYLQAYSRFKEKYT